MEVTPTRCVVYAAKSTEDRRGSIPDQLRDCRGEIERASDRAIEAEYVDEAFSAFTRDRGPGLREAMRHAEELAQAFGGAELWAQHSDRLARGDGRTARHAVEIALWALKRDVRVRTVQDPDTFRDLLYAVVTGQRNHEDSRRKSQAVGSGRRRAAERGEHLGYRPDGYRFVITVDPTTGKIEKRLALDPERESVIRMIFDLALKGRQPGTITRKLNAAGFCTAWVRGKPPAQWTVAQVCSVLRNPRYAGLVPFKGKIVAPGEWPAYVAPKRQQRIVARIGANKPTTHRRVLEPYLLAKLAICGRCGSRLYAMTGHEREDGTFSRRYICASHARSYELGKCSAPPIDADTIEAMVISHLAALVVDQPQETSDAPERSEASRDTWESSPERAAVLAAVRTGDDGDINAALTRLLTRASPQAALLRQLAISRRQARQLDSIRRLEAWAELERVGRTEASRSEAAQLNRMLRGWFTEVAITAADATVEIVVTHRTSAETPERASASVRIDLREWARSAADHDRRHRRYRKWTDAAILGALQGWVDAHGHSPRFSDWRKGDLYHPSSLTVRKHFGAWAVALRAAGVPVTYPNVVPRNYPWHRNDIVDALQAWAVAHGRPPRWNDWLLAAPDRPCTETVRSHFGSFAAGLRLAGLLA